MIGRGMGSFVAIRYRSGDKFGFFSYGLSQYHRLIAETRCPRIASKTTLILGTLYTGGQ
jgi:hypothetical protein